ncbi:hypothetical protein G7Z17_g5618 [Cylindrodendrum hubeiense]|uniref:Uncharacterized protein n=1 Tax=Cylindrodendrum hubeiense TaxID=595255 RepID=A0A9P5HAK1_9HYPO|nr:hypothetical protein G7Z17_g5618 [Cylindrodendrum hubeiense]
MKECVSERELTIRIESTAERGGANRIQMEGRASEMSARVRWRVVAREPSAQEPSSPAAQQHNNKHNGTQDAEKLKKPSEAMGRAPASWLGNWAPPRPIRRCNSTLPGDDGLQRGCDGLLRDPSYRYGDATSAHHNHHGREGPGQHTQTPSNGVTRYGVPKEPAVQRAAAPKRSLGRWTLKCSHSGKALLQG